MKIVIAPDSFKESLSAMEVASAVEEGFREIYPDAEYVKLPVADGGEGTVAAMVAATQGELVKVPVIGPLGDMVESFYGRSGDGTTAVIEMAAASGLDLVPQDKRNPMVTTSFGTGQLICHALNAGIRKFIVGIGGSATNDGGAGMLQALGVRLLDSENNQIGHGGGALADLKTIDTGDLDPRLRDCFFEVACDVSNPLTGEQGASAIFGPQKGATPEMVQQLDNNLGRFATLISRDLQKNIGHCPGAGAAGGMGAAFFAFLNAELRPGVDIVVKAIGLESAVKGADLVITGEGRIDGQTLYGKAPIGVSKVAAKAGVPVFGLAGSLGDGADVVHSHGLTALFSIVSGPCSLAEALTEARANIKRTTRNIAATLAAC